MTIYNTDLKREIRRKKKRKCVFKEELARWYKTGNYAVEAVDLGRREERTRRSNEGDKQGSSSLPPSFSLFLSLSLLFKSPRHKRISTRQRSYSPLDRASSRCFRRTFVLASSFEQSFADLVNPVVGGTQFFFLHLSFLPFSPPSTIVPTTLSLILVLGALLPSPFSLVSHLCLGYLSNSALLSASISVSIFLRNFFLSHSFYPFSIFSLFLYSLSSFSLLHSSCKGQEHIAFSFLLFNTNSR